MGYSSTYEWVSKVVLPAVKVKLAKALASEYGKNEKEIAEMLDVTQACVSKYLSGKYSKDVKEFASKISDNVIAEYAAILAKGKEEVVCELCEKYRGTPCYLRDAK